jgi:transposase
MQNVTLTPDEIAKLRIAHRTARKKRDADRIKAIVLLGKGWTFGQVAEALLVDEETIRQYLISYKERGIKGLLSLKYKGKASKLSDKELKQLEKHLEKETYLKVEEIIFYIKKIFNIKYTVSGMTDLMHRMGFVYKKPKVVPGKADKEKQKEFIDLYNKLKSERNENDPFYFLDGVHPQHNTIASYGWIKKGVDKEIKSNTGRQRININGAINIDNFKASFQYGDSINAQTTVLLLKKLERANKKAVTIYAFADNATYYRSKIVTEYLKYSKIKLIFLPPYSPNLNIIERLWKFFKKKIIYNKYYETFEEFKFACKLFFKNIKKYKKELASLLTDNFQLFETQKT